MHLEDELFATIVSFVNKAKIALAKKDYSSALTHYQKAENAFPHPIENYTGSSFLYVSMAETYRMQQDEENALLHYRKASACIDGIKDPGVWLNIGMMYLRQKKTEEAKENLFKAYELGGKKVFAGEPGHSTFFETEIFWVKDREKAHKERQLVEQSDSYKIHDGKSYTKAEWEAYEAKLWHTFSKTKK